MIMAGSYETPLPANVNDSDLWYGVKQPLTERSGITQMSFILVANEVSLLIAKLHSMDNNAIREREVLAISFSAEIEERFTRHCDPQKPFEWLIMKLCQSSKSQMLLGALRPM